MGRLVGLWGSRMEPSPPHPFLHCWNLGSNCLSPGLFSLVTKLSIPPPPVLTITLVSRLPPEQCLQEANLTFSFPCFPGLWSATGLTHLLQPSALGLLALTPASSSASPPHLLTSTPHPSSLLVVCCLCVPALPFSLLGISFQDSGQVSCLQGSCIHC